VSYGTFTGGTEILTPAEMEMIYGKSKIQLIVAGSFVSETEYGGIVYYLYSGEDYGVTQNGTTWLNFGSTGVGYFGFPNASMDYSFDSYSLIVGNTTYPFYRRTKGLSVSSQLGPATKPVRITASDATITVRAI
jgi:hypothetical protein